ncbi:SRPBCC family protein [Nocardioides carbamazepini]|uniref:SRPBCC family protein n=1 Tax=Nocardioides carbamazepini TaxID=2854259 RepID=UPI00214A62BA|nr:SRPBCC family protein [Nocardioides carbamazepini]MCR1781092.1 SRPBCC family protein [Nocardioides carbamazepini]
MLLTNEFEIDADLDQAWALLTDLERIMPCMPGAALDGREGDTYLGNVRVKVGPIGAHFRGTAHFAEKDDAARSAVIAASGKDPKGQAAANARIHARLEPMGPTRTRVLIDTDLDISGRMAQFGRGAIADVSNRLMGQFVANIGALLDQPESTGAGPATPSSGRSAAPSAYSAPATAPAATAPAATAPAAADLDVMALVLPMVKERYGQAILGGLIGFALSWLAFGRKGARS